MTSYKKNGYGLWLVTVKITHQPIGICGLIRRVELPDMDLGFAFLPSFTGQGYAFEASQACLQYAKDVLKRIQILAITSETNSRSKTLLAKLGFELEKLQTIHQQQLLLYKKQL